MTTIMVGVQNSVIVLNSSDDYKNREISKGSYPRGRKSNSPGHSYLTGIAVDSGNPDVVIVSASDSPFKSFSPNGAETFLYKKDDEDGKKWKVVSNGLPDPNGTTISILASNQKVQGEFYAVNNHGIFILTDSGESWRKLTTEWPKENTPLALAVSEK